MAQLSAGDGTIALFVKHSQTLNVVFRRVVRGIPLMG